jgi:hypothetical protein
LEKFLGQNIVYFEYTALGGLQATNRELVPVGEGEGIDEAMRREGYGAKPLGVPPGTGQGQLTAYMRLWNKGAHYDVIYAAKADDLAVLVGCPDANDTLIFFTKLPNFSAFLKDTWPEAWTSPVPTEAAVPAQAPRRLTSHLAPLR